MNYQNIISKTIRISINFFQDETSDASGQRQTAGRRTGDASEWPISAHQVLQQCSGYFTYF